MPNSDKTSSKESTMRYLKGFKGPCAFRQLSHFDVYGSFLCDTLHNLYLGVTVRLFSLFFKATLYSMQAKMLKLLLSKPSPKGGISGVMSVHDQLNLVAQTFGSISYPSTTYRQPRDIRLFKKFKGNELRIFLLFGYS